jgi:hypothetical protein
VWILITHDGFGNHRDMEVIDEFPTFKVESHMALYEANVNGGDSIRVA